MMCSALQLDEQPAVPGVASFEAIMAARPSQFTRHLKYASIWTGNNLWNRSFLLTM